MDRKILHIANCEKFMPPFVEFVKTNFNFGEHEFQFKGGMAKEQMNQNSNVQIAHCTLWGNMAYYVKIIIKIHKARKIILHGLFDIYILLILLLMPWLLKKCYWLIWGGDLYRYEYGQKTYRSKIKEFIRRPVLKNIGNLITYIPGDITLARKWYGAKGKYHECLMYPSNLLDPNIFVGAQPRAEGKSTVNILVGNSADPSNNHFESLEKLYPFREDDLRIFVPLSYGDSKHAQKVIELGKAWFGKKFVPVTSFMAFSEYLEFLKNIDVVIFNHKRQQAMGNTITLLGIGKTVYLRSDVTQWSFFEARGIKCLDVKSFNKTKIDIRDALNNSNICLSYFNADTLRDQYAEIFKG